MADLRALQQQADQAAAAGDARRARMLLEDLARAAPAQMDVWLKLASMCRATGDLDAALQAVEKALGLAPLDFTALLLRATLLERAGRPDAGEAYSRAVAQRPAGGVPPAMAGVLAHAQQQAEAATAERDRRLSDAAGDIADPAIAERVGRFRSNIVRRTRTYHSEPTHYFYPGLIEREFHDRADFPWLAELEAATDTIRAEFRAVAGAERAELVPYIQYAAHEPLAQWRPLNHSRDWTAIHLLRNGHPVAANARLCPETMRLLARLPQPQVPGCSPNAMFSLLAPETSIPPHTGVANTRLVCHLPLIVPQGCWFRVGATTREWHPGEAFVFDDTIEHEAANPTKELRVVLIFDIWHPQLSAAEQRATGAMMGADAGAEGQAL